MTMRLLSINSYHYRRGGADGVYFDHAALFESIGWQNAFFAMHYPKNLATPWSRYFVDEIQFGHDYGIVEKIGKASKVVYSFEARDRLARLLRDFRPDVAHVHNVYHHLSPSVLSLLRREGIPSVMTAHDLKIACPNNKMLNRLGVCERCRNGNYLQVVRHRCVQDSTAASAIISVESFLHRWLDSYRRNLDRIVVPSRFYIDKFVEWGWPRTLFTYIPNYVDAEALAPRFDPGDHFLFLGRLAAEKGVGTLVAAAARAGVALKIAGTGPLDAQLRQAATDAGARIEFLGFRSGDDLFECVRRCRAVVVPSEWYENAPMSVLEAFALGKPVIGARIGGIPELVRPGQTGWLFDSGDQDGLAQVLVQAAAASDDEVAALGREARATVAREYSRDRYVDSMLALYREIGVVMRDEGVRRPVAA